MKTIIAPSLLAADFMNLEQEIDFVEKCGADWHHLDVMDGHFVPNLTFGLPIIRAIKERAQIPLDVHIMISNPERYALQYIEAGASSLSFHVEAATHPHSLLSSIRRKGALSGIAINPGTSLSTLKPLLFECDFINMMSINPGFGGQKFLDTTVSRITEIRKTLTDLGLEQSVQIQIDGGINLDTAKLVLDAGANILVAGTFLYNKNNKNAQSKERIQKLRSLI